MLKVLNLKQSLIVSNNRNRVNLLQMMKCSTTTSSIATESSDGKTHINTLSNRKSFKKKLNTVLKLETKFATNANSTNNNLSKSLNSNVYSEDSIFNWYGLSSKVVDCLYQKDIQNPTPIQQAIIPLLMQHPADNFVMSSATGSGKTLGYLLPVIELLLQEESLHKLQESAQTQCAPLQPDSNIDASNLGEETLVHSACIQNTGGSDDHETNCRRTHRKLVSGNKATNVPVDSPVQKSRKPSDLRVPSRPRCLILVPTRDLVQQVLSDIKMISHHAKVSSCGVVGGGGKQTKRGIADQNSLEAELEIENLNTSRGKVQSVLHTSKMTSITSFAQQKANLSRKVDIVVATPGRILQHFEKNNVKFTHIKHIVIDEIDTMLLQGFNSDLQKLLYYIHSSTRDKTEVADYVTFQPRIVMVTATVTKALKSFINIKKLKNATVNGSKQNDTDFPISKLFLESIHRVNGEMNNLPSALGEAIGISSGVLQLTHQGSKEKQQTEGAIAKTGVESGYVLKRSAFHSNPFIKPKALNANKACDSISNSMPVADVCPSIPLHLVELEGVNQGIPQVQHRHIDTTCNVVTNGGVLNKLDVLVGVLKEHIKKTHQLQSGSRVMIFCNTITSCRAVDHHLNQVFHEHDDNLGVDLLSYHGDLNSTARSANLQLYRSLGDASVHETVDGGHNQSSMHKFLICTDIAARGLDIPSTSHVVMFDFPLNPVEYLHRAGRTGRAGRPGIVTALVSKRDKILSHGIQLAMNRGFPLDQLSSNKYDYYNKQGYLHHLMQVPNGMESDHGTNIDDKDGARGTDLITEFEQELNEYKQQFRKSRKGESGSGSGSSSYKGSKPVGKRRANSKATKHSAHQASKSKNSLKKNEKGKSKGNLKMKLLKTKVSHRIY